MREGGREGEREKRVDHNTNCFVQLHTCTIPHESHSPDRGLELRLYTQDCMPPTTAHCSVCVASCLVAAELVASHCGCGTEDLGWVHTPLLGERRTGGLIHTPGEGGSKGGRDRGREDQSMSNFKSIHFLYMKFDALWPLDNSDVKDLTKMNQEVCIKNASIVWMGREKGRERGCFYLRLQYIRRCSFICN